MPFSNKKNKLPHPMLSPGHSGYQDTIVVRSIRLGQDGVLISMLYQHRGWILSMRPDGPLTCHNSQFDFKPLNKI